MSKYLTETDDIQFSEPILAQKAVRVGIVSAEKTEWEVKAKDEWTPEQKEALAGQFGKKFTALKLKIQISDDTVRTEHEDAKPKLTIEDQFNIERYPYYSKKLGRMEWLGRAKLYQLEEAFGFEPVFTVNGAIVEAFVTKSGKKVAPKTEGVKRIVNPDFFNAYFTSEGEPNISNWVGKTIYADIDVEKSEKFGDKNVIARYVKSPVI